MLPLLHFFHYCKMQLLHFTTITTITHPPNLEMLKSLRLKYWGASESTLFIALSHSTRRLPSCDAHTTRALAPPHPIRVGGPDLWYQMALVDTTVEQSLVSSAEVTRGRECVRVEDGPGSPRWGQGAGWDGGMGEGRKRMRWGVVGECGGEGRKDGRR